MAITDYALDGAARYHSGQFPPTHLDYAKILRPLSEASAALARYDAQLGYLPNKDLLLAPLRNREAVITSRIEGTVSTLDEVLQIQADIDEGQSESTPENYRQEALEAFSYTRAILHAQSMMARGLPICSRLMREAHARLLFHGRGADKHPGAFKTEQNYVVDRSGKRVLFIPIAPKDLSGGMDRLERYINEKDIDPLLQTAVSHLEFEALHPFNDGNGRIGRMLITLNLWDKGCISSPNFYISDCIEERRDEYIDRLRRVSANGEWDEWVIFFLDAVKSQADRNRTITSDILDLYSGMKAKFHLLLKSQWHISALDYIFERGVFRNSAFTKTAGIPAQTAHRITKALADAGLLRVIVPSSGRRSALYAFTPLLELVR